MAADKRASGVGEGFLLTLSDALRPLADPAEIQATAVRVLGEHLCPDRAYYVEVDDLHHEYVVGREWLGGAVSSHVGRYALAAWPMPWLADGQPWVVRDVDTDPVIPDDQRAAYRDLDIRACIVVPLIKAGRLVATLVVNSRTPRDWTDGDVRLLIETSERTWAAVERARAEAALRASEQRWRDVIESIKDYAIFTIDPKGIITSWNEGARRLKGYTAEEIIGRPLSVFYPPEDAAKPEREMQTALAAGRSEDESWRVRKDGSLFWVNEIMTPLRAADGRHLGFSKISRDLTERKVFEDALRGAHGELEHRVLERTSDLRRANAKLRQEISERRAAEAQIKSLFERMVSIQEEERRRIAREIHDHLGQQLTALRMNIEVAYTRLDGDPAKLAQAQRTAQLAEELDRSIDFLTWELRPAALDHLGLSAALQNLVSGWSERFGIEAEFDTAGMSSVRLAPDVETNLYRVAQEALHNIVKHAEAAQVTVLLQRRDDEVVLVIEDDGLGFALEEAHEHPGSGGLGLASMRERAVIMGGELEIDTARGRGTSIFVRVPVRTAATEAGLSGSWPY